MIMLISKNDVLKQTFSSGGMMDKCDPGASPCLQKMHPLRPHFPMPYASLDQILKEVCAQEKGTTSTRAILGNPRSSVKANIGFKQEYVAWSEQMDQTNQKLLRRKMSKFTQNNEIKYCFSYIYRTANIDFI